MDHRREGGDKGLAPMRTPIVYHTRDQSPSPAQRIERCIAQCFVLCIVLWNWKEQGVITAKTGGQSGSGMVGARVPFVRRSCEVRLAR